MRRRATLILLVLVLIAAVVNFPLAMWLDKSRTQQTRVPTRLNIQGAAAAEKPWPARTPHAKAWPAPRQYSESHAFGYTLVSVWGVDGNSTTHQMSAERIGWPLPCVQRVQMWWPWNDPAWQTTAEPDPKESVYWPGAVLNPFILGGGAWALLVGLPLAWRAGRSRRRRRANRCEACGYPRGSSSVCTECGSAHPTPALAG
jgi:hypothetical protein